MPSGPQARQVTFDDGPDPIWTPLVLARLRDHRVQATFFVLGHRLATYARPR